MDIGVFPGTTISTAAGIDDLGRVDRCPVRGTTNWRGIARFAHTGPPCVAAVAFFVNDASRLGGVLDRSTGQLTSFVIPPP
jgi:hypothetical protein